MCITALTEHVRTLARAFRSRSQSQEPCELVSNKKRGPEAFSQIVSVGNKMAWRVRIKDEKGVVHMLQLEDGGNTRIRALKQMVNQVCRGCEHLVQT